MSQWVFKNLHCEIKSGARVAITGQNGSGKSTLLQVVSGFMSISTGALTHQRDGINVPVENWHGHLSYAAPYLELPEEYTLKEIIYFQSNFKPLLSNLTPDMLLERSGLGGSRHKPYKHFSSGMKQRARLMLAICSEAPLLLLDEPLSNLDAAGAEWYQSLIEDFGRGKTIIVCSNNLADEISFCQLKLNMADFKEEK